MQARRTSSTKVLKWSLAIVCSLLIHILIALYFYLEPVARQKEHNAAAPKVIEVNLVSAPDVPSNMLDEAASEPVEKITATANKAIASEQVTESILNSKLSEMKVIKSEAPLELNTNDEVEFTEPNEQTEIVEVLEQNKSAEENLETHSEQESPKLEASEIVISEPSTEPSEQFSAPQVGAMSEAQQQQKIDWQGRVQAHLERKKRYPRAAKIRGQQGAAWLNFSIDREGNVLDASLFRSSGFDSLDNEALALIARAAPLPKPPSDMDDQIVNLTVPIAFYIQN